MTSGPFIPDLVEKTMSASPAEFHRSMAVLDASLTPALSQTLECKSGTITVTYDALPSVTLGTLLALPRARVTVRFAGVPPASRAKFMCRFDLAFQRGGG
jgi:hypothetical protein